MNSIKLKVTNENLDLINKYKFNNIEFDFLNKIVTIVKNINSDIIDHSHSYVEINKSFENEFIMLELYSKNKIPIKIVFHKYGFDLSVANNQSIFEMTDPKNIEISYLNKWFTINIINKFRKDENNLLTYSKFYNKNNIKDVLYFDRSIFNFLYSSKYEIREYESWL